jgi:hypothetical protein
MGCLGDTPFKINVLQASTVTGTAATFVHLRCGGPEPMPRRILIVDDNAPNRELIREALTA